LKALRYFYTKNRELTEAVIQKDKKLEDVTRSRRALDETKIRIEEKAEVF